MTAKGKVNYKFKMLYAIGALMLLACHGADGISMNVGGWFSYYYVSAIFVFASGYFYRDDSEGTIGGFVLKKVKKLLIPMYVYNLIYGCIIYIGHRIGFGIGEEISLYNLLLAPVTNGHQFELNLAGWFVVPLFIIESYMVLFRKLCHCLNKKMPEWAMLLVNCMIGVLGNWLAIKGYNTGAGLIFTRCGYFLPFYAGGIFYARALESREERIPDSIFLCAALLIQLGLIWICRGVGDYIPSWCTGMDNGPVIPVIAGFVCIAFWLRVSKILEPSLGRDRIINTIANSTYSIMMNHLMGFMLVKAVFYLAYKYIGLFENFDMYGYLNSAWYFYVPRGIWQTKILYMIGSLAVCLLIQKMIDSVKNIINSRQSAR